MKAADCTVNNNISLLNGRVWYYEENVLLLQETELKAKFTEHCFKCRNYTSAAVDAGKKLQQILGLLSLGL